MFRKVVSSTEPRAPACLSGQGLHTQLSSQGPPPIPPASVLTVWFTVGKGKGPNVGAASPQTPVLLGLGWEMWLAAWESSQMEKEKTRG